MAIKTFSLFSQPQTPKDYDRRKKIAEMLVQGDKNPVAYNAGQGALLAGSKIIGGLLGRLADEREKEEDENAWKSTMAAMTGGVDPATIASPRLTEASDAPSAPERALPTFAQGDMAQYANAISKIESGGRYDIVGPPSEDGDRPYGRFQVMGKNIGPWTEKYVGRRMTPEEFLKDKEAQHKVFEGEFGSYVKRFGNPQDAASMWFSGRPLAEAGGRKDVLGTTVPEYVSRFTSNLSGSGSAPLRVERAPARSIDAPPMPPQFDTSMADRQIQAGLAMMRNPRTRDVGFQMYQQGITAKAALQQKAAELGYQGELEAYKHRRTRADKLEEREFELERDEAKAERERRSKTITLSPGQRAVDADGNIIAEGAPKPDGTFDITMPDGTRITGGSGMNAAGLDEKKVFETLDEGYKTSMQAVRGINSLRNAKAQIDRGVFGLLADERLAAVKGLQLLGFNVRDQIEATEVFKTQIAPQISALMKATVGSANISNADLKFAEKAAAGDITLDAASIKRTIEFMEKASREAIRLHNQRVDQIYPDLPQFQRQRAFFMVKEPEYPDAPPVGTIMDDHVYKGGDPADPKSWEKVKR